ncbi:hypothetical protein [Phormidium nigroviride]
MLRKKGIESARSSNRSPLELRPAPQLQSLQDIFECIKPLFLARLSDDSRTNLVLLLNPIPVTTYTFRPKKEGQLLQILP